MRPRLPFPILFEDRDVLVIDKPAGMLTTHTKVAGRVARESQPTAENLLNGYVRKGQLKSRNRVWLVHRLDRETSGVMMFAKSEAVAETFRSNWNELTEKTYLAKVVGGFREDHGVYESYLLEDADGYRVRSVDPGKVSRSGASGKPKLARTEWRLLSQRQTSNSKPSTLNSKPSTLNSKLAPSVSLVEVKLKSGRKNQIRVHFSEAGHPVVGDVKYGGPKSDRLYLHALRLRFRHPHSGEWLEFSSPPPF